MEMLTNREVAEEAFEAIIDSVERVCDLSAVSLMSKYQGRLVVDVRRMMCKIMRQSFNMSYQTIGDLLNKNHSTIVFHVGKHDDLYVCDRTYANTYNQLMFDVGKKVKSLSYRPVKNGSIKLREIYSSEKEIFNVMAAGFATSADASVYANQNGINKETIIYHGPSDKMPNSIAHELVFNDEKKYMEGIMRKSMDLYKTVIDAPVDRYYTNYLTGECDILNDAPASLASAFSVLGNKPMVLIYTQRQR